MQRFGNNVELHNVPLITQPVLDMIMNLFRATPIVRTHNTTGRAEQCCCARQHQTTTTSGSTAQHYGWACFHYQVVLRESKEQLLGPCLSLCVSLVLLAAHRGAKPGVLSHLGARATLKGIIR